MSQGNSRVAGRLVWAAVVLLAILHYDFWYWGDRSLVLGFLPIGLAFHALFSLTAAAVWALAIRYLWPSHVEEWADQAADAEGDRG